MNNNKQKPTHTQQPKFHKLPQLQPLLLEQLDGMVAAGHELGHAQGCYLIQHKA